MRVERGSAYPMAAASIDVLRKSSSFRLGFQPVLRFSEGCWYDVVDR